MLVQDFPAGEKNSITRGGAEKMTENEIGTIVIESVIGFEE